MSPLSAEDVHSILKSKLKDQKYELISCKKLDLGSVPIGFLSEPEKVCVEYKTQGCIKELFLFIKRLPTSDYHRKVIISNGAFQKEVVMFDMFLNELKSKLEGNPIPTCYLGRVNDIVVLQDLSHEGFSNLPLLQTFSVDHCTKALESLAKLHAASLIFELRKGCKINEYIPLLQKETIFSKDKSNTTSKAVLVGLKAIRCLKDKYLSHYEEELTEKVFKYLADLPEKMVSSNKYPNVLSHCDMWGNNIMFRYDQKGKVIEACIIDFQLAAYRPLGYDALMLLYTCTDKDFRDKHCSHLLKHYYNHLSQQLYSDGQNLSKILPWTDFVELINELFPVLLAVAPQFLHFVLMPDNHLKDVMQSDEKWIAYYEQDRSQFALQAAEECLPYKNRVIGALRELFEYFLANNSIKIL